MSPNQVPPGQAGLLDDKTVEFLKDPAAFIEKQCERYDSRVFLTRLILRPTLVLAEHNLVTNFLNNCMDDFVNGFKDNFSGLFGDNIMFASPSEAEQIRKTLLPLFDHSAIDNYKAVLNEILEDWSKSLDVTQPINFYEETKNISLTYNLEVFMGVKKRDDEEFFNEVKKLATDHWHGVMSLPVNISVPFFGNGGYKKATTARKKLLKIIEERLSSRGSDFFEDFKTNNTDMTEEQLYDHMLLFSCALIPKGVASVLSTWLEIGQKWNHLLDNHGCLGEEDLNCVLLEVIRMFPPFMGGCRVALKDTQVGPYHIQSGTAVYYSLHAAMRDPVRFVHPEMFMSGRWRSGENIHLNLGFSTGPHDCIGRQFTWACLKIIANFILTNFTITFPPTSTVDSVDLEIKLLPVLRPKSPHMFTVLRKSNQ